MQSRQPITINLLPFCLCLLVDSTTSTYVRKSEETAMMQRVMSFVHNPEIAF